MKQKYLIFGATGSIGSSLSNQLYEAKKECHLIGRNKVELEKLANKLKLSQCQKNQNIQKLSAIISFRPSALIGIQ